MTFPFIFSFYIARQILKSLFIIGGGLFIFILTLDFIELINRTSGLNLGLNTIFYMQFLKALDILNSIFPYMVIFSMMYAFYQLNTAKEITVARSMGISGIQIAVPAIMLAFLLGLSQTFILNHLAVTTYNHYTTVLNQKKNKTETIIDVSSTGLWLREATLEKGFRVINGKGFTDKPFTINSANILELSSDGKFAKSYSADKVELKNGEWVLSNSHSISANNKREYQSTLSVPTKTTYASLKNIFKDVNTVSFWKLQQQINTLKSVGLNSSQYVYMFNFLLSLPILFSGLAMIALFFAGRPYARQQKNRTIVLGVATAFSLFFYLNLIRAISSSLPFSSVLSGWLPSISILFLGLYLLLNSEKASR